MGLKLALVFVCALGAAPLAALADDPTATPDHTGKQVDGKTNGITSSTAETVQQQEKEQPDVKGVPKPSAPSAGATPQN